MKLTDVPQFMGELGAGVFEEKLAHILSDVASAVLTNSKQGEVSIKLKMKRVGSTDQVNVEHTLAYKKPKKRGQISEDDSQETVMYVNEGFNLSQFPENQMDMLGNGEKQNVTD